MRYARASLIAYWLLSTALAFSQTPVQGAIEGTIVNSVSGEAIPNARVKLTQHQAPEFEPRYVFTDAQGHFEFLALNPAEYRLVFSRTGFLRPGELPNHAVSSVNVDLTSENGKADSEVTKSIGADGVMRAMLHVPLIPAAVVLGKITDPSGLAVSGALVRVRRALPLQAGTAMRPGSDVSPDGRSEVRDIISLPSNDHGEFRFGRLQPGTYYVMAERPRSWDNTYHATYFPRGLDLGSATPLQLMGGQETRADIQIARRNGVHVTGQIVANQAPMRSSTGVQLIPGPNPSANASRPYSSNSSSKDRFDFEDVLPGTYTLVGMTIDYTNPIGIPVLGAWQPIEVPDHDLVDLAVTFEPLSDLTGIVTFATGCTVVPVRIVARTFAAFRSTQVEAITDRDGRFVLSGLLPSRYTLVVYAAPQAPAGTRIKADSARLGDREVLKDGFAYPSGATTLQVAATCDQAAGRAQ